MSYPRENTIQVSATGPAGAAATVKLPNASTVTPGDQAGAINPIGATQRWRLRRVIASYSAAPAAGMTLTITDGQFTWTVDANTTAPIDLGVLDLQCAPGAEVDITLSAPGTTVLAHLNVSVASEG